MNGDKETSETDARLGYTPVFKVLTKQTATRKPDLDRIIDRVLDGAIHVDGNAIGGEITFRADQTGFVDPTVVKGIYDHWSWNWRGHPRKTEVYYALIPLKGLPDVATAMRFATAFEWAAFGTEGMFGYRDYFYALHQDANELVMHLLVNRHNGEDLLAFHHTTKYTLENMRSLLQRTVVEQGIALVNLDAPSNGFTMGFREALKKGIDYRTFEKVECLPLGIDVTAVAGVWGDGQNLRCLFTDVDGNKYLRNIRKWFNQGYWFQELELDAKHLEIGQVVKVINT